MNEITSALVLLKGAIELLPRLVEVGNIVDELNRQHEHKMKLRYSEEEYLKTILALYQSGKINASEARKALALIFRDSDVNQINLERDLYRLIGR